MRRDTIEMDLTNFENYISSTIVKRGKSYFKNGYVIDLTQLTDTDWGATVEGTHDYTISVRLSEDNQILSSDCNCPYDGPYCKHEVAVFYALQRETKTSISASPLETILNKQTKDSLVRFILDVAHQDARFQQKILNSFTKSAMSHANLLKTAEKTILKQMKHVLRNGYISPDEEESVLSGVEKVIDDVQELIEKEEFRLACELTLLCYSKTVELHSISDNVLIQEEMLEICNNCLDKTIHSGITSWTLKDQEYIFSKLIDVAYGLHISPYWQLELLQHALPFCEDPVFSEKYYASVAKLSYKSEDYQQQAEVLMLRALIISEDEEGTQLFIDEHQQNPSARETLIYYAFEHEDYEKALKLSSEGIDIHFGEVKLRSKWEQFAYDAHKKLGNLEAMRGIAFIRAAEGDFHFYHELKELYNEEEWHSIIKELIVSFDEMPSYPTWYPTILIEENEFAKLLSYCQLSPSRIFTYSKYLKEDYPEEVKALYYQDITKQANNASNRSHYKELRKKLLQFQKAGYASEVKDVIQQLKFLYPRRTVLHEELRNLRLVPGTRTD